MMNNDNRDDEWTGAWVAKKIRDLSEVESVDVISSNILNVVRKGGKPLKVATMACKDVTAEELNQLIGDSTVDFIINVPSNPMVQEDAFALSQTKPFGLGGMGDFSRAVGMNDPTKYLPPEVEFILRGVRQHTKVASAKRLDPNRYEIERIGFPSFIMVALNEYELTADTVRTALDEFGEFDLIVASNPNRGPTTAALEVAKHAGKQILTWPQFLSALHKPWN